MEPEKVSLEIINIEGEIETIEVEKDSAPPQVCTPGETTCINGTVHKCNSSGRWFATGSSC